MRMPRMDTMGVQASESMSMMMAALPVRSVKSSIGLTLRLPCQASQPSQSKGSAAPMLTASQNQRFRFHLLRLRVWAGLGVTLCALLVGDALAAETLVEDTLGSIES